MNEGFRFKQFTIVDELCGMKIGTDGVLLGAWAEGGKRILDIGTGSGLISMMLAQRYPSARITAIDIEKNACIQAENNILKSPFCNRINIKHISIQQFSNNIEVKGSFDAIVCNPPFFNNSLVSKGIERTIARHSVELNYFELCQSVEFLLNEKGVFSVILPMNCHKDFLYKAQVSDLFVKKQYFIKTMPYKEPKRCLISFVKKQCKIEERILSLVTDKGQKEEWYRNLTEDFYLY